MRKDTRWFKPWNCKEDGHKVKIEFMSMARTGLTKVYRCKKCGKVLRKQPLEKE